MPKNRYQQQIQHTNMMRSSNLEVRRMRIGKTNGTSELVFSLCSGGCWQCQQYLEEELKRYLDGLNLEMTEIPQDLPAAAPAEA